MSQERRELPRWQIKQNVRFRLEDSSWREDCCLLDMNLKGISISLSGELPPDPMLRISLGLKDELNIQAEIQIRWQKTSGERNIYGASINKMPDQDKEEVLEYLTTNCLAQFKDRWWQEG